MHEVDLDKVVKDNYDSIKKGRYVWKDEEVESIYKLARFTLNKVHCPIDEVEDMLQDLLLHFLLML